MACSRHGERIELQFQTLKGPLCRSTCKCKDDIKMGTGFVCVLDSYSSQHGQINDLGNAVMNVHVS